MNQIVYTNHGRIYTEQWPPSEVFPEGICSATLRPLGLPLASPFGIGLTRKAAVAACCKNIAYYQRRARWDAARELRKG